MAKKKKKKRNSNEWTEAHTGTTEQRVSIRKYCLWEAASECPEIFQQVDQLE